MKRISLQKKKENYVKINEISIDSILEIKNKIFSISKNNIKE